MQMYKKTRQITGDWRLYYAKNSECADYADKISSVGELLSHGLTPTAATVPGSFVLDLYNAGKIPDPFFGDNALKLQYLEAMHVWYAVDFDADFDDDSGLLFEGLDTVADVYLDGKHILRAENMFTPHSAAACGKGRHSLLIHFSPVVIEARKYRSAASSNALWYNYQGLYIRKSAHMFGWDILPRLVSCGIWKPIYFTKQKPDSINDVYVYTIYTKPEESKAKIRIFFDISVSDDLIQNYTFRFSGKCGDSSFCEEITPWGEQYGRLAFEIENAKLWWPRGYGEPNLYDCKAELLFGDEVLDAYELKIGLRTVELLRSESVKDGEGQFLFKVNGVPVFWRGVNWSPLSPFPSESEKRLDEGLEYLWQSGSNCVRMWGGGIYECDEFFDFCDSRGIMVWQDFMMACAVYPQDEKFKNIIEKEVAYQVCRLRSHASLCLWSGDNECDCAFNTWGGVVRDPNDNVVTRETLPRIIRMHDFSRPYLPSSPYISPECFKNGLHSPEEHLWGDRPHFKSDFYTKSECCFVSEIGHHGAVSPKSAEKFIGGEYMYPILDKKGNANPHWLAHSTESTAFAREMPYAYRMRMLVRKVTDYVNELPSTYADFAKISQIIQAEAVKFFIELFRGGKWRRTGIIYWNLADGWPLSCEAVVDYYGTKKLAFEYMRRAYQPVYLMLRESENGLSLVAVNDTLKDAAIKYTLTDALTGDIIARGDGTAAVNDATDFGEITLPSKDTFCLIEWECGGEKHSSHYYGDICNIDVEKYISALKKCGFDTFEGF